MVCDSQGQEPQAAICAKKLINDDQVNLLVGDLDGPDDGDYPRGGSRAFRYLAWSRSGHLVVVKKWRSSCFRTTTSFVEIDFARNKGWKRVALITEHLAFGGYR